MVANYAGTLLLVSHDRAFLDNVVTGTLVFEGGGQVNEYVGGYTDWLRQRRDGGAPSPAGGPVPSQAAALPATPARPQPASPEPARQPARMRRLSYKEQRELDGMPEKIQRLEAEQSQVQAAIADPALFQGSDERGTLALKRLAALAAELEHALCALGCAGIIGRSRAGGQIRQARGHGELRQAPNAAAVPARAGRWEFGRDAPAASGMTREDALFAAHFLQLTHGLMNGLFGRRAELVDGRIQGGGVEFEADRDGPHRGHHLGLSDEQHRPRGIHGTVGGHRRQAANRAHLAVGERFLAINLCRIHGCLAAFGGGTHAWATPCTFRKAKGYQFAALPGRPCYDTSLGTHGHSSQGPRVDRLARVGPYSGSPCCGCIICSANIAGTTSLPMSTPSPRSRCCGAALFTLLGYGCLTLYDALAVRFAGARVPYPRVALISFMGYAIGHNVGLNTLSGGAIRYRAYSALGLGAKQIATIIAFGSVTFLLGAGLLLGLSLLTPGGHVAIGAARACLAVHARRRRAARGGGGVSGAGMHAARAPEVVAHGHSGAQAPRGVRAGRRGLRGFVVCRQRPVCAVAAAGGDELRDFAGVYLIAIAAGIISNVPGGIGVFEAVLLLLLPSVPKDGLLGALVAYRAIYYFAPFAAAPPPCWARTSCGRTADRRCGWCSWGAHFSLPSPRRSSPIAVFLAGAVLLFSGATPGLGNRLDLLRRVVPLPILELSHLLGSAVGVGLLVIAHGLYRRLDAAWWLTHLAAVRGNPAVASQGASTMKKPWCWARSSSSWWRHGAAFGGACP